MLTAPELLLRLLIVRDCPAVVLPVLILTPLELSDNEICSVCDYLVATYGPDYMFNLDDLKKRMNNVSSSSSLGGRDIAQESEELLYQIAQFCVDSNACSINSIQNQFQLGFNRASRIVTMLEDREIVSPKNGTKSREILVDTEGLRRMFGVDDD